MASRLGLTQSLFYSCMKGKYCDLESNLLLRKKNHRNSIHYRCNYTRRFMNDARDNRAMVVSLTPRTESEPFNAKEICKASLERTGGHAVALLLCGKGVVRYDSDAPPEEFELPISKKRVVVGPNGDMIETKRTLGKDLSDALDDVPVDVPVVLVGYGRLWRFLKTRPLKRVLTHILYGPTKVIADDAVGLLSNQVEVLCLEEVVRERDDA